MNKMPVNEALTKQAGSDRESHTSQIARTFKIRYNPLCITSERPFRCHGCNSNFCDIRKLNRLKLDFTDSISFPFCSDLTRF